MRSPDFWSWFDGIAGPQLAHRTEGFRKVFDHLDRTQPVSTIPTGRSNTSSFDAGDQFGLRPTICRGEHALIKRNRKLVDSPLEGDGFELSVRSAIWVRYRDFA